MQFDRLKRRGVLSPDLCEVRLRTFRRGLKETDYVEGQNVKIEYRYRFMLLSLDLPRSLVRYCCGISFFAALAICSGIGGQVLAQAPYDNSETPEGWAWARIKEGKAANFNERCGTPALDPRAEDETGWTNSCRRISATFLVDILTRAPWRNQVSFAGVNIIGTRIEGDIDFQNAKLDRSLMVEQSQIENNINFDAARTDSVIGFVGSRVAGRFSAEQLRSELSLDLGDSEFRQKASLNSAKVDGNVGLKGATFDGDLDATALQVGGSLLMGSTEQRKTSFKGVSLSSAKVTGLVAMAGATFDGDLDATALQVGAALLMGSTDQSKTSFKGVSLSSAKVTGLVAMAGATFDGDLDANSMQVEGHLSMESASFKRVSLFNAKVTGRVRMAGATFDGDLNAMFMQVGGDLSMWSTDQSKTSFKEVSLGGAKVTGNVFMDGATFDGDLNAISMQVGADLSMGSTDQSKTSFKGVSLGSAKVTGNVSMIGATFDGDLGANSMQVGADLSMGSTDQSKTSFKGVSLSGANVTGNVFMDGATFDGDLDATALQVGANLFMGSTDQSKASFKGVSLISAKVAGNVFMNGAIGTKRINMVFARIGDSLDIRGTTLAELDLSGASIAGELRLRGFKGPNTPTRWRTAEGEPGKLILRNTRIANLTDAQDAWPTKGYLHLDGFTFARLGGFTGDTGPVMRARGMDWWDDWIRRDPAYSPTPYEQLAAALVAAGDRAAAEEVRFFGRVRQRETEKNWGPWILSGFLQYAAGFGIGTYTFRVLYWVIGISVLGALYLWKCVPAAYQHGPIWCFGASLSRLLPVIEVNKEFTDFFNDPGRTRLTSWQSFVFSLIGIVGWVLGAILIAAISGLMQKP